jgi:hypothetical protein
MFDGNVNEHALCFRHVKLEFWQGQLSAVAAASFQSKIMSANLSLRLLSYVET